MSASLSQSGLGARRLRPRSIMRVRGGTMPMYDWTRVEAGIYHAFHHEWVSEIGRALNRGLLPADYYALPEQQAAGFGPDVLTLQDRHRPNQDSRGTGTATRARPKATMTVETPAEFYRRKKSTIVVRHM